MTGTDSAAGKGGRKTYPAAGIVVFAVCMMIGFGLFGSAGVLAAGPALPLALGTWRWGLAGFLGMLVLAALIFGGCVAIIAGSFE